MPNKEHLFILQEEESFVLYKALVETRQTKELEFDDSRDPRVLEEIAPA